jgi:predicted O-methyltransferase YrrM
MTQTRYAFPHQPPAWATGHISSDDAAFLSELIQEIAPTEVVEIGVASGYSSAMLLHALASVHGTPDKSRPWLYSFDAIDYCYFDAARPVGSAVGELVPELRPAWRMTVDTALGARRMLRGREIPFAFIDADHRHPWATFDFLALLPILRRGAWVAFHDVRMPQLSSAPEYQVHGPQYLFDAWPWTKRIEPVVGNMGACRIDAPIAEVFDLCVEVLTRDWEVCPPRAFGEALGLPAALIERNADEAMLALQRALRPSTGGTARPLIIWGAGEAGRKGLALMKEMGYRVDAFVDRDVRKQAGYVDGLAVRDPNSLRAGGDLAPFIIACGMYSGEIARDLETRGFTQGQDFAVVLPWC